MPKAKTRTVTHFHAQPSGVHCVNVVIPVETSRLVEAVCNRLASGAIRVLRGANVDVLASVLSASSDEEVMLRVLQMPSAVDAIAAEDPLAPARMRGVKAKVALLEAEGGSLSSEQVAELLQITRQAVDKRRRLHKIIGLGVGRHGYRYPAWQFAETGTIQGLEQVLNDLKDHDAWMQAQFMVAPNSRLGGRAPLAALKAGDVESVQRAARVFGEHGAA